MDQNNSIPQEGQNETAVNNDIATTPRTGAQADEPASGYSNTEVAYAPDSASEENRQAPEEVTQPANFDNAANNFGTIAETDREENPAVEYPEGRV
jgi:hypothetical protein